MSQIRFDFSKANSQISELDTLTAQISALSSGQYEQMTGLIRDGWSGAGADAFLEKTEELREKISAAAASSKQAADAYRTAVNTARLTEEEASRIAEETGNA